MLRAALDKFMKLMLPWGCKLIILCLLFFVGGHFVYARDKIPQINSLSPEYRASNVDTASEISITFNMPMDRKTVEKNFSIFPETKGTFRWKKKTLIFKPRKPLLPSTAYFISFTPEIKAKSGFPLIVNYFTTPAHVAFVNPEGKISIVSTDGRFEQVLDEGRNPVWTPDNKSIIYEKQGRIWKIDIDQSNRVQLTANDESYQASIPAPNPSVDLIAFIGTNAAGIANVYTQEIQTEIVRQLTAFFEPGSIDYLRWSPDGLYLAFLREGQIWIMNQDGKDLRKLTTDELVCKTNFSWSPGGTKIAFGAELNLWIGDIYSFELRKISFDNPQTGMLDWSDTNKIAFKSNGLTIMEADGSSEIQVASAGKMPVWANDKKFLSYVLPLHKDGNSAQLWIMSADGLKKEKIAVISSKFPNVSWSKQINFNKLLFP